MARRNTEVVAQPIKVLPERFTRMLYELHVAGLDSLAQVDQALIARCLNPDPESRDAAHAIRLFYQRFGILTPDTRADRVTNPKIPQWILRKALSQVKTIDVKVTSSSSPSQSDQENDETSRSA